MLLIQIMIMKKVFNRKVALGQEVKRNSASLWFFFNRDLWLIFFFIFYSS